MVTKNFLRINLNKVTNNLIFKMFFVVLLLELFLLGSGRLLEFGSLTARMVLFILAILLSIIIIFSRNKIDNTIIMLLFSFFSILSIATFVGLLNSASFDMIREDLKPLFFFVMILSFSLFIKTYNDVNLVVKLIKFSSFLLAILYLLFLISMYLGLLDFKLVYHFISEHTDDIMFRGIDGGNASFFYKGFLYLNIGFIFYVFSKDKFRNFILFILLTSIILTFTRGFLLALFLSFIFFHVIHFKEKKSFYLIILIISIGFFLIPYASNFFGERGESDLVRIIQIQQVIDNMTPLSILIGHGFGIGVEIREMHMEIAFLEIFHKQGLLGIFFWLFVLYMIVHNYLSIHNKNYIVKSFLVSTFFVYVQSATNPFLNNPIGMTVVLLSLIILLRIKQLEFSELKVHNV